jgi:outer membrane protein
MKKVIFTVFAISFGVITVSAQVPKGTILTGVSSNIGFSSYKPDGGTSTSNFNVNLRGGYFIIDNLVVGLNLGFNRTDYGSSSTGTSTGLGVFARYYIIGKIFVGGGFDAYNAKTESGGSTIKSSYTTINGTAGYAWFIIPSVAVEPALNLEVDGGDLKGMGLGARVGFTIFLNRKDN